MNPITAERMEHFAEMFSGASSETQDKMWNALRAVFTSAEINGLQKYVGAYKLLRDDTFYRAAESATCETLYAELSAPKKV